MLAQLIAKETDDNVDRIATEHIQAAAALVPTLVNDFLNRVHREATGRNPSQ